MLVRWLLKACDMAILTACSVDTRGYSAGASKLSTS